MGCSCSVDVSCTANSSEDINELLDILSKVTAAWQLQLIWRAHTHDVTLLPIIEIFYLKSRLQQRLYEIRGWSMCCIRLHKIFTV